MARIEGVSRLITNLEALATITDDDSVVRAGGQVFLTEQQRLVRAKLSRNSRGVLEGTLQIIPISSQQVEIGVPADTLPYALAHEFGVTIFPKKAKALRFEVDGKIVYAKSVTLPARPYVRPSVSRSNQAVKAMIGEVNLRIRGAVT